MNKDMQNGNEMQEEELYALLDKALSAERLTVSEELIQKTLQRVAAEEDSKVISFEKAKKKKVWPVAYAGVAAAALVVVLGMRAFNGGSFTADDMQMKSRNLTAPEAEAESAGSPYELLADATDSDAVFDDNGTMYHYSVNESQSTSDLSEEVQEEPAIEIETLPQAEFRGGETAMASTGGMVSEELIGILADAGMAVKTGEAEYWEFAATETNWEQELLCALRAGAIVESELPKDGRYGYTLDCKDSSRRYIASNQPLDAVVRLKTERGVIWGLLGEGCDFYME